MFQIGLLDHLVKFQCRCDKPTYHHDGAIAKKSHSVRHDMSMCMATDPIEPETRVNIQVMYCILLSVIFSCFIRCYLNVCAEILLSVSHALSLEKGTFDGTL